MRFSVASSGGRPRPSPQAARTAGATCRTTTFSGSLMAASTRTYRPLPQRPGGAVGDALAAVGAADFRELFAVPHANACPAACAQQIPYAQPLDLVAHIYAPQTLDAFGVCADGWAESYPTGWPQMGLVGILHDVHVRRQRLHAAFPLRTQVGQLQSCWDSSRATVFRRCRDDRWELVWITIPSMHTVSQEAAKRSSPWISTTHTRQAATSLISFR